MHRDCCHWEKVGENFPPISIRLKIFYLLVFVLGSGGVFVLVWGFLVFCFVFSLFVCLGSGGTQSFFFSSPQHRGRRQKLDRW